MRAKADVDVDAPRVVLCGNPRILNPICAAFVERGCRVWWLYERFAVRSWWRWRRAGVEQLVCDAARSHSPQFSDVFSGAELSFGNIDLARPIERWLSERAADVGRHQSRLIDRVESHFSTISPTAVVLDEDATPLKRIAAALARRHGARSSVVQHGAPCGSFGFVPAADEICVWGEPVRRQLETWGVEPWNIRVTGWPQLRPRPDYSLGGSRLREKSGRSRGLRPELSRVLLRRVRGPSIGRRRIRARMCDLQPIRERAEHGTTRFLLLATVEPRDERPDNVEFHLTSGNYEQMLEMVESVLSKIEGARLIVKPHPRSRQTAGGWFESRGTDRRENSQRLPVRVVRSKSLAHLVADSDCVLSCGSTAGIEAALAGAPVVQLLPVGSGDILPADDWGFAGTARTPDELAMLVQAALARGWRKPTTADAAIAAAGDDAASAIVEGLVAACDTACSRIRENSGRNLSARPDFSRSRLRSGA